MHKQNSAARKYVISFIFSSLMFGFLTMGAASATTVNDKSGDFVTRDYSIKGDWAIVKRGDQHIITFSDDFKTKNGPDLKIFLSPRSIEDVRGRDAAIKAVLVSKLKSSRGAQEYVLPADIDLADYKSLLIHCEAFGVLWGGTNI